MGFCPSKRKSKDVEGGLRGDVPGSEGVVLVCARGGYVYRRSSNPSVSMHGMFQTRTRDLSDARPFQVVGQPCRR